VRTVDVRIKVDTSEFQKMLAEARELFLDLAMHYLYHDDLCDPQEEVFV
jgi:hypothetical protein